MNNYMGKAPSLKNSTAVGQGEIQKAKQNMGNMGAASMGMTSGAASSLSSSTAIGQAEIQDARKKVQESGSNNPNTAGLV